MFHKSDQYSPQQHQILHQNNNRLSIFTANHQPQHMQEENLNLQNIISEQKNSQLQPFNHQLQPFNHQNAKSDTKIDINLMRFIKNEKQYRQERSKSLLYKSKKLETIMKNQERNEIFRKRQPLNINTDTVGREEGRRSLLSVRRNLNKNNYTENNQIQQEESQQPINNKPSKTSQLIHQRYLQKEVKKQMVNYHKFTKMAVEDQETFGFIEISDILGSGANAIVKLGHDKKTHQKYAIKIYQKYKLIDIKKKKRVQKQIQILSRIQHQNIINLYSSYEDKRQIHMIFEHIQLAVTLQDFLRINKYNFESEIIKQQIIKKIAEGIAYLHDLGISHRDIKADNIIINEKGVVKIIDFGFATTINKGETHCGTPNYMAPQLFTKKTCYNPFLVDVWAFGVLIYYMNEGCYPFRGYNEKDLIRNINVGVYSFQKCHPFFRKIINSTLSVNTQLRITMKEILKMFNHTL